MGINFTTIEQMTVNSAITMIKILNKNNYNVTIENGKLLLYHK